MAFADLTLKQQLFIRKYIRAAIRDEKGDQNDIVGILEAWLAAKEPLANYVAALPKAMGRKPFQARIKAAETKFRGKNKVFDLDDAKKDLKKIDEDAKKVVADFGAVATQAADENLEKIRGYHGRDRELTALEEHRANMDAALNAAVPDIAAVAAGRDVIAAAEVRLLAYHNTVKKRFAEIVQELDQIKTRYLDKCAGTPFEDDAVDVQAAMEEVRKNMRDGAANLAEVSLLQVRALQVPMSGQLEARTNYERAAKWTERGLAKLTKDTEGVEEDIKALRAELDVCAALAEDFKYLEAGKIFPNLMTRVEEINAKAEKYKAYNPALIRCDEDIATLRAAPGSEFLVHEMPQITALRAEAIGLASDGDFAAALATLAQIEPLCAAATKAAAASAPVALADTLVDEGDVKGIEALLALLKDHPNAQIAKVAAVAAQGSLNDAAAAGDADSKKAALVEAASQIKEGWLLVETFSIYVARVGTQASQLAALLQNPAEKAFLEGSAGHAQAAIDAARDLIEAADMSIVAKLVDVQNKIDFCETMLEGYRAFVAERQSVIPLINELTALKVAGMDDAVKNAQGLIESSLKALDPSHDLPSALSLLGQAKAIALTARVMAKVQHKDVPDAEDIKTLIDLPGGTGLLDEMIIGMKERKTQMDVLIVVMGARFDMDVTIFKNRDADKKPINERTDRALSRAAPNLLAFYQAMTEVPEVDTRLNPSLKKFVQIEESGSSNYGGGEIQMICYGSSFSEGNDLGDPDELLDVDENCRPVPDKEAPMPTYGKWTTLHEIGHAVDDRESYMKTNGNAAAFGGWEDHGKNFLPIAEMVAEKFEFDRTYIAMLMAGDKVETPDVPDALIDAMGDAGAETEWLARKAKVDAWCAATNTKAELWNKGGASATHAIGGRVYHESYAGKWVSYDLAARNQGITGYQFRAPGEWFSELYAAFYAGKLKDSHPSHGWLSAL